MITSKWFHQLKLDIVKSNAPEMRFFFTLNMPIATVPIKVSAFIAAFLLPGL
jgi:hypothetical protein